MRHIFLFCVIIGIFLCSSVYNESAEEENSEEENPVGEKSDDEKAEKASIKVGALFDVNVEENTKMFQYAIEKANEKLLADEEFQLEGEVIEIDFGNEFNTSHSICGLLEKGVSALFGPSDEFAAVHVSNICDAKEIPYIDTRYDEYSAIPIVNMYPNPATLAQLVSVLVVAAEWKSFTILYETPEWLPHMTDLLEMYDPRDDGIVTVKRLDVGLPTKNYRAVLREVKMSSDFCLIIECSIENLGEILKQAQQIGLLVDKYHFIITNLDAHTIDLEPYQYSGANITILGMIDTSSAPLTEYAEYLKKADEKEEDEKKEEGEGEGEGDNAEGDGEGEKVIGEIEEIPGDDVEKPEETEEKEGEEKKEEEEKEEEEFNLESVRMQTALIYDGIFLLADTFKQLGVDQIQPANINCMKNESAWEKGLSISNFMRNTIVDGMTKSVQFDENGLRSEIEVQISSLNTQGVVPIATWDTENGIKAIPGAGPVDAGPAMSLSNRTFIVLIALTPPYGMLVDSSAPLVGNDRFEGFAIDIIHELSLMLGFKYEFRVQEDKDYGGINKVTKEWTGMIRALQDDQAHLAITDLTITSLRESGADFTMPFMNLGISILYLKPTKEPPSTFSFLSPFSTSVWVCLGGAYFTMSLVLFLLGRLSPSEWDNPYPCIEEPTQLENQFTFANSMWFCIGALLQQGSEIAPKAPATRLVASLWWFFTLLMVSSYTANLAAFLTIENPYEKIKSVESLKDCGKSDEDCPVKFGAKPGGATFNFFKDSDNPTYRSMYKYMDRHPELMFKDNDEGVRYAADKENDYAFLMESSSIEYVIERTCEVAQVGGLLDDKGYGIAMKKNADYRNALSEGILKMQESGKLAQLKIKWWKEKRGGGACQDSADSDAVPLELANVIGVFYVLAFGVFFALIIAFVVVLFETLKVSNEEKQNKDGGANPLNVENVNGVFIVLFVGCSVSLLGGYIEFVLICYKNSKKFKVPFKEELMAEMKFILKFETFTKEVRHRKSESIDSQHSVTSFPSNESGIDQSEKSLPEK